MILYYTIGNGTAIKGSIMAKATCAAIFGNTLHMAVVCAEVRRWLRERVSDPADARFFRQYKSQEPQEPPSPSRSVAAPSTAASPQRKSLTTPQRRPGGSASAVSPSVVSARTSVTKGGLLDAY